MANCLKGHSASPRTLLAAAGQLNSLSLIIGPKALYGMKIFYRESLPLVRRRFRWDNLLRKSSQLTAAIQDWILFIFQHKGSRSLLDLTESATIFSDASAVGAGAFMAVPDSSSSYLQFLAPENTSASSICVRSWSEQERAASSTWRELKIIEEGLRAFRKQLRGKAVMWLMDNLGATAIARKGSTVVFGLYLCCIVSPY